MDEYSGEVEGCAGLAPTSQDDEYSGEVEGRAGSRKAEK
jgi:hypothetical protein